MKKQALVAMALGGIFAAQPASAAVDVCTFNTFGCYGIGDLGAFSYVEGPSASNVSGATGYTGAVDGVNVLFKSTTDNLNVGQVGFPYDGISISGTPKSGEYSGGDLDQLSVALAAGFTFTGAIFNLTPFANPRDVHDTVTVFWDGGGSETVDLWSGTENWFAIKTSGGQKLTGLQFNGETGNDGWGSLSSLKFTGVSTALPEPSTWAMMILGFALVGGAMRRGQRQTLRIRYA